MYVPVCVFLCVPVCVPPLPPLPHPYCGAEQQNRPPHPHMTPHPRSRIRAHKPLHDLPLRRTTLATPSACYRGPKPQKCPRWLGEGAKGVLDPRSKGLPRVFCTTKTLFCTGATLFRTSARGLWRPWPKRPFAPSPNLQGEIIYPPPFPHFRPEGNFQGRGVGVYILRPHAARIFYAPPFSTPPTPRRVFSEVGGYKIWPLLTTFGNFLFSGPLPGPLGRKTTP